MGKRGSKAVLRLPSGMESSPWKTSGPSEQGLKGVGEAGRVLDRFSEA